MYDDFDPYPYDDFDERNARMNPKGYPRKGRPYDVDPRRRPAPPRRPRVDHRPRVVDHRTFGGGLPAPPPGYPPPGYLPPSYPPPGYSPPSYPPPGYGYDFPPGYEGYDPYGVDPYGVDPYGVDPYGADVEWMFC
jgi:hypothetical protein